MNDPEPSSDSRSRCARFVVRGHVQGVFFRSATQQIARSLGLNGWVRNCVDGSVELVACGDVRKLGELESWLWKGPPESRVREILRESATLAPYVDFLVRR